MTVFATEDRLPVLMGELPFVKEVIVKGGPDFYNKWLAGKGFEILNYPYLCLGRVKQTGDRLPDMLVMVNSNGNIVQIPYCAERFDITPENG